MAKLAQLPANDAAPDTAPAEVHRVPRALVRYYAFLSYSHKDEELADWLHRELEEFRVPHALTGKLTEHGVIPKRLTPIFRDQHELAAAGDLGEEIREALECSQFLIVLCSPDAAKSHWTNAEIETFKKHRPDGCVLAAIASGEPFASDLPGREDEECFPPALRQKFDRRGRPTGKRAEPLAADLRGGDEIRRHGFLKLVAGMLGVGLDDLVQRETTRRHRRLAWLAAASLAGMAVTSTLAFTAIQSRDAARDQRREAEGLVAFMLGDLRDKLEPIGRLDALDGVGSRVLAYYSKQDTSQLSDAALMQRSRALSLMAEVAYVRGDVNNAQKLYREALTGTAEAIRRNPDDPQRVFDHAQNVFWIADIARERGEVSSAEVGMREYKRLADRMVTLAPDNMKWRMEQQSANTNLGVFLFEQRRFQEALLQFEKAFQNIQALTTADPANAAYIKATTESQSWLADAVESEGRLDEARELGDRNVALIREMLGRTGDVEYRQKLVPAERHLGEVYLALGDTNRALSHFQAAVDESELLIASEPSNSRWRSFSARARLNFAEGLLAAGKADEAASQAEGACHITAHLQSTDPSVQTWRATMRDCWKVRARVGLARGDRQLAAQNAARAVDTAKAVRTTDPVEDRFELAQSYLLLGDVRAKAQDAAGARDAWQAGLAAIPSNMPEKPTEMAAHALLLKRLGRNPEARDRSAALTRMGYQERN